VIGPFKTELIKPGGPWRTAEQVEAATLHYVHWFNHHRLLEINGDLPPIELEQGGGWSRSLIIRATNSATGTDTRTQTTIPSPITAAVLIVWSHSRKGES
jgi:hypothetical protein